MEFLAPIISAIGTIIVAWFAYNQKTKDQMTALKIEQIKKNEEKMRKLKINPENKGQMNKFDLF